MRRPRMVLAAAVAALACAPAQRDLRRERQAQEARALAAALDDLDERLAANQERIRFWRAVQARQRLGAVAVACAGEGERDDPVVASGRRAPARPPLAVARVRVALPEGAAREPTDDRRVVHGPP